jgi:hypothetical protein
MWASGGRSVLLCRCISRLASRKPPATTVLGDAADAVAGVMPSRTACFSHAHAPWSRPRRTTRWCTCAPSPPSSSCWWRCACCATGSDGGVDAACTVPCSCPSRRARPGAPRSTCARSWASGTPAWTVSDGGFNSRGTRTLSSYGYCRRQQYAHFTGSLGRVVYVLSSYLYQTNSSWPTVLFVTYKCCSDAASANAGSRYKKNHVFAYAIWPPFDSVVTIKNFCSGLGKLERLTGAGVYDARISTYLHSLVRYLR